MKKYRKKPIVIEAEQFLPPDKWVDGVYIDSTSSTDFSIDTLEGDHEVTPGDWIITGIAGEKYPCKPGIFEATYEPVDDTEYSTNLYQ